MNKIERDSFEKLDLSEQKKPKILHIAADYPDCHKPVNTVAVKNLIDTLDGLDHHIIIINRTAKPWNYRVVPGGGSGDPRIISIRYWGFPYGVLLALSLYILARQIRAILRKNNIEFDVIHAHKFTFEGLVAYWLSRWTKKPMVCSVRGEAETKVFRAKPHYKPLYGAVARRSKHLYFVSAWMRDAMHGMFRFDDKKERLLPNFIQIRERPTLKEHKENAFASIFFLGDRRKGLDRLLPAFRQVVDRVPTATLDIIGPGEPAAFEELAQKLKEYRLEDHVRALGRIEHDELFRRLPTYAGIVLASRNETFAVVYVELLLCGVPILYSKNTGIDGFFDGIEAAKGGDPFSVESVRDGWLSLVSHQHIYRNWLQNNVDMVMMRFSPKLYAKRYVNNVTAVYHNETNHLPQSIILLRIARIYGFSTILVYINCDSLYPRAKGV